MALSVNMSYTWTNYCRLCLLDKGIMVPIFGEEGVNRNVTERIETSLQILTYEGDPMPRNICHSCLYSLNLAYDFRCKAVNSLKKITKEIDPFKHVDSVKTYLSQAEALLNSVASSKISFKAFRESMGPLSRENFNSEMQTEMMESKMRIKTEDELNSTAFKLSKLAFSRVIRTDIPAVPAFVKSTNPTRRSIERDFSETENEGIEDLQMPILVKQTRSNVPMQEVDHSLDSCDTKSSETNVAKSTTNECILCNAHFSTTDNLMLHVNVCLICSTCKSEFPSAREKAIHEAAAHIRVSVDAKSKSLSRKCRLCSDRFLEQTMLAMHIKYVHALGWKEPLQDPDYIEDLNEKAADGSSLSDGESKISSSKNQNCRLCQRQFSSKGSLSNHMKYHDSLTRKCTMCENIFSKEETLQRHMKEVHGEVKTVNREEVHWCHLCQVSFTSLQDLGLHEATHPLKKPIVEIPMILVCDRCKEHFQKEDDFLLHLYKHAADERKISCRSPEMSKDRVTSTEKINEALIIFTTPEKCIEKSNPNDETDVSVDNVPLSNTPVEYYDPLNMSPFDPALTFTAENDTHFVNVVSDLPESPEIDFENNRSGEMIRNPIALDTPPVAGEPKQQQQAKRVLLPCVRCNVKFNNFEAVARHSCFGKQIRETLPCLDCGQLLDDLHDCTHYCSLCNKTFKRQRGKREHDRALHKLAVNETMVEFMDDNFDDIVAYAYANEKGNENFTSENTTDSEFIDMETAAKKRKMCVLKEEIPTVVREYETFDPLSVRHDVTSRTYSPMPDQRPQTILQNSPLLQLSPAVQQSSRLHQSSVMKQTPGLQHSPVVSAQQSQLLQQSSSMQPSSLVNRLPLMKQSPGLQQSPVASSRESQFQFLQQSSVIRQSSPVNRLPLMKQSPGLQHSPVVSAQQSQLLQQSSSMQPSSVVNRLPVMKQSPGLQHSPVVSPQPSQLLQQSSSMQPSSVVNRLPVMKQSPGLRQSPVASSRQSQFQLLQQSSVIQQSSVVNQLPIMKQSSGLMESLLLEQFPTVNLQQPQLMQSPSVMQPSSAVNQAPLIQNSSVMRQTPVSHHTQIMVPYTSNWTLPPNVVLNPVCRIPVPYSQSHAHTSQPSSNSSPVVYYSNVTQM